MRVRVEQDRTRGLLRSRVAGQTSHAAGLQNFLSKDGLRPAGGTIRAEGHQAASFFLPVARTQHDSTIGELHRDGFIGSQGHIADLPSLAIIIAVNRGGMAPHRRWDIRVHPKWSQEPSTSELDAMPRTGRNDLPVVFGPQFFKNFGDLNGLRPS